MVIKGSPYYQEFVAKYVWKMKCQQSLSLGPRPKTNPSVDHFQYRTRGRKFPVCSIKYTHQMRSGEETSSHRESKPGPLV